MLADEIPQPIQWYEGMLLAPQHFQLNAARQEMLVQYSSLLVGPYCWGVRSIELGTLSAGKLVVLKLEAVLPDGSVVTHEAATDGELSLDLEPFKAFMGDQDLTVFVATPARTFTSVKGTLPRYKAQEGPLLADENTQEGEFRIKVLKPILTLMPGRRSADGATGPAGAFRNQPESGDEEPKAEYVSLRIARVSFKNEAFIFSDYVAPTMSVPLLSPLGKLCNDLANRLREKAKFVSEQALSPTAISSNPFMLNTNQSIQSLVAGLPPFEALLSTGSAHPLALYLSLCGLSGHLASLGRSRVPPKFASYNHNDPLTGFKEVLKFSSDMIDEGIPVTFRALPFKKDKDSIFSLLFQPDWANLRLVIAMRIATGVSEKETIDWATECLIGSDSIVQSLRDKRIRGASREFIEADPELVPVRGVLLFALDPEKEFVKRDELLLIRNLGDKARQHSPLEILLYVKQGA